MRMLLTEFQKKFLGDIDERGLIQFNAQFEGMVSNRHNE